VAPGHLELHDRLKSFPLAEKGERSFHQARWSAGMTESALKSAVSPAARYRNWFGKKWRVRCRPGGVAGRGAALDRRHQAVNGWRDEEYISPDEFTEVLPTRPVELVLPLVVH